MHWFVSIGPTLAAGLIGLALAPAPAAPVPVPAKPPPFLPTAVGAKWVVGDPANPDRDEDRTYTVTAAEETKDGLLVTVADRWQYDLNRAVVIPGQRGVPNIQVVERADRYRVAADGVYRVAVRDGADGRWEEYDRPCCVMAAPAAPGAEWTNSNADGTYTITSTVVGPERVTVPAGTFDAVRVRTRCAEKGGRVIILSSWHVPGIGLVKNQTDDPPDPRGLVLYSFTPAKK